MTFANQLKRLRQASTFRMPGSPPGKVAVDARDLRELLYHFDRIDAELRALVGLPQVATVPDDLTCEDIERLRLALSWEGYSTPESLESCAARWPSLVRDLIAGVLDRKKRTQAAAKRGAV